MWLLSKRRMKRMLVVEVKNGRHVQRFHFPHHRLRCLEARFAFGDFKISLGAMKALEAAHQNPLEFLSRHLRCDWGEVDVLDWFENDCASKNGSSVLSKYDTNLGERLLVMTEEDGRETTMLLAEEYLFEAGVLDEKGHLIEEAR